MQSEWKNRFDLLKKYIETSPEIYISPDEISIPRNKRDEFYRLFDDNDRRRTPDLSDDATMITYTKYFGNNSEVYYADIKDQNEIRVSYNSNWDGHPMISPDGTLLVYEEKSGGKEDLIIYDLETGGKTNITNTTYNDRDASFLYQK